MAYVDVDQLLQEDLAEPEVCDALVVSYRGIRMHVHGFLHGVTGAGNRKYREFIQRSIDRAPGLKLIEKGFSRVYTGIDTELEDWLPISLRQAFTFPVHVGIHPNILWSLTSLAISERMRAEDRFSETGHKELRVLGDSPKFHLLEPHARRKLCGFPDPETYLRAGVQRRLSIKHEESFRVAPPDPNWAWMGDLERIASIALRSLHMIAFAVAYAKARGVNEVSLFVGEIHNTDIQWLTSVLDTPAFYDAWSPRERTLIDDIYAQAYNLGLLAAREPMRVRARRAQFELVFLSGSLSFLTGIALLTTAAFLSGASLFRKRLPEANEPASDAA